MRIKNKAKKISRNSNVDTKKTEDKKHISTEKPIEIFFHAAMMLRFDEVFWLIFDRLLNSRLVGLARNVTICFVGNDVEKFLQTRNKLNQYKNVNCILGPEDVKCYEFPTLQKVWESCQGPTEKFVFYCHTKGVSYPEEVPPNGWIYNMLTHTIDNWSDCIGILSTYDGCGLMRRNRDFFSGNFWWANSSFIKTLPYPIIHKNRFQAEYWISKNPDKSYFILTSLLFLARLTPI